MIQTLNAWGRSTGLILGQRVIDKGSNEITALPDFLKELQLKGCLVTLDAMGCQKKIVEEIVEQEADYIITLKKNQKGLYEELMAEMERQKETLEVAISRDKGHGRAELRKVYVSENLTFMEQTENWRDLNSVILVERSHWEQGKKHIPILCIF